MDPVTQSAVAHGAKEIAERTEGFLRRVAGPAADEIGLLLQDRVRLYRYKNQLRMVEQAETWAAESGRDVETVPMRILLPLLEGGGLESDPALADMWAALLARAAIDEDEEEILPSYPSILKQLSPADAEVLSALFTWEPDPLDAKSKQWGPEFDLVLALIEGREQSEIELVLDNLIGLGLVERRPSFFRMRGDDGKKQDVLATQRAFRLTTLGIRFVAACSPPTASSGPDAARQLAARALGDMTTVEEAIDEYADEGLVENPEVYLEEPQYLYDREIEDHHEILLQVGPAVEEIWGAIRQVEEEPDKEAWERMDQATQPFFVLERLRPGEPLILKIPKPPEGKVTIYQVEPRCWDEMTRKLLSGEIWRGILRHQQTHGN